VLYDKICRDDILRHAYGLARAKAGAPGVDGVSFAEIEEQGLEASATVAPTINAPIRVVREVMVLLSICRRAGMDGMRQERQA
jgi:hypothetical protein